MVYVLREGSAPPRVEHDRHYQGLFPRSTWLRLLTEVGFDAKVEPCRYDDGEDSSTFVGVRPHESGVRKKLAVN
jgi:hypothetical protein